MILALARPLSEFVLKELVSRPRPVGDRLVRGRGPSFPSGHPYATAASWGVLPLVAALYVRRRAVWWAIAAAAWILVVAVAASRVWLGVHWATDVVAGVLLAVLGVRAAEWLIERLETWRTVRSRGPATASGGGLQGAAHGDDVGPLPDGCELGGAIDDRRDALA